MKKWIPMITVFCLLFSLTACGAGSGTNGNTEHSSMQSQIEAPSSEPAEKPDASARPAIGSEAIDISSYDTVFIGHPIWWGTTPRIINTFLDTYDLSGKTVLPFCTSGSSGISQAVSVIRAAEPDADVRDGLRASGANDSSIENWIAETTLR